MDYYSPDKIKSALTPLYNLRLDSVLYGLNFINGRVNDFDHYISYVSFELVSFTDYMRLKVFDLLLENNINPAFDSFKINDSLKAFNLWMIDNKLDAFILNYIDTFIKRVENNHSGLDLRSKKIFSEKLIEVQNQFIVNKP